MHMYGIEICFNFKLFIKGIYLQKYYKNKINPWNCTDNSQTIIT